jgi:micrococcal nuclease
MYEYKVKSIERIYDGDTITVNIDLGFHTYRTEILRFANLDTPEIRGSERPDGLISRDYVVSRINEAKEIIIRTYKDKTGKYGRYIADIYLDGVLLNDELIEEGLAEPYMHMKH